MSNRLTSTLWVEAYLRKVRLDGAFGYLAKRGADAAGAIYIRVVLSGGDNALYGPAPQSVMTDETEPMMDRIFELLMRSSGEDIEAKLDQEKRFDPDIWVVEVENSSGAHGLTIVDAST